MALFYFPKANNLGLRNAWDSTYQELIIANNPNMVFYFDTGSTINSASALVLGITSSWAQTASISQVLQTVISASWSSQSLSSSYTITASYASNAGVGSVTPYTTLTTSSTNWITASFLVPEQYVTITNALSYSFTSSNLPSAGQVASTVVYIANTATATSSLAFPSDWVFMGMAPTYITASKDAVLSLRNYGGTKIVAAFTPQF